MISFQIKPWVALGLLYLLIELFYIGMPVVRADGRSLSVRPRVVPSSRKCDTPRVAFSRVGWFSRALGFRSLYYPWGKMGITRSLPRWTVTWLPNFLGWVDYHISLAIGVRPRAALLRYYKDRIKSRSKVKLLLKNTQVRQLCKFAPHFTGNFENHAAGMLLLK